MMRAQSSSGNPPTPVPKAGSAIDSTPSSSATSRQRCVVRPISFPFVCRSCPMTAPWMTWRAGSRPAPVAIASPTEIGPFATASSSISSPPARRIAPATPAPIQSWLFAAFAIASTRSCVMSPSITSSSSIGRISYGRGRRPRAAQGPGLHADGRVEPGGHQDGARPRRRAEGAAAQPRGAPPPSRADARDDLPEAFDANPRLVRGRDQPARRPRPLPARRRPPARPRRDDQGHGRRPLPLPRRDHDPHLSRRTTWRSSRGTRRSR